MKPEMPILAAEQLRWEFDSTFSRPVDSQSREGAIYLLLRAGGLSLAVPAGNVRELVRCPEITILPGSAPAVLGVGAIRGALVALYDLASLLQNSLSAPAKDWLFLIGDRSVGVVFEEFLGSFRLLKEDSGTVENFLVADTRYTIVDLNTLLKEITQGRSQPGLGQE